MEAQQPSLFLVRPALEYERAFLSMLDAWRASGGENHRVEYSDSAFDFSAYLTRLDRKSHGQDLPEGHVPSLTFWLTDGSGVILGTGRVRYWLNDVLMNEGGNIGYDIHPGYRKKGYGTQLLRLLLAEAAKLGIENALVTCDADNEGSRRIIERNGGVYNGQALSEESGKPVLRYWVATAN